MNIKYTFWLKSQIKLFVLLTLFAATVSSSTLARLDSLRWAATMEAGVDSLSDQNQLVSANRAVNIAIQEVSGRFPAVRKAATILCADSVASYAISDTTFRDLVWCRIWTKHPPVDIQNLTVLKVVPADSVYEYVQGGKSLPKKSDPPHYAYAWADSLHVSPVPNYKDTLKYGYCAIGRFLSGDTATTDIRPEYRHLIVVYAAYLIRKDLRLEATPPW